MRRMHLVSELIVSASLVLIASPVFAGDTFFVDSTTGNDANSCTSADQACLTIAQARTLLLAQENPQNSKLKLAGTFTEAISFDDGDVASDLRLDGLRITATDTSNRPTIDATGHLYGVVVTDIHEATIDHLIVTGSKIGISVRGNGIHYVDHISIHHNRVTNLTADPDITGIELWMAKQSVVEDNDVVDINIVTTDDVTYETDEAYYLYFVRNIIFRDNAAQNVTRTNTLTAASNHTAYIYGLYAVTAIDTTIKNNTFDGISMSESGTVAGTSHYPNAMGLYFNASSGLMIKGNTIANIATTANAAGLDGNSSYNYTYGLYMNDIRSSNGTNTVQGNSISLVTATQNTDTGYAYSYGVRSDYSSGILFHNNTLRDNSTWTGGTLDSGSYSAYTYGLFLFYGFDLIVTDNTVRDHVATAEYTGATATSYTNVQGIVTSATDVQLMDNTIRDLTWILNNSTATDSTDYPYLYGLNLSYNESMQVVRNTVRGLTGQSNTTGASTYLNSYIYGINIVSANNLILNRNVVRTLSMDLTSSDITDTSYGYGYIYPVQIRNASGAQIQRNRVQDVTMQTTGNNDNEFYLSLYGYYLNGVEGMVQRNTVVDLTATNESGLANSSITAYAAYILAQGAVTVNDNTVRDVTITSTSSAASQSVYGYYLAGGKPLLLVGNRLRNVVTSSPAAETVVGISANFDASSARLLNNVILGQADYASTGGSYTGLSLPSTSTRDVDVIHNTLANWRYPIEIKGGSKVYLLNNILAAISNDGYPMAVEYEQIDLDTFKSDYNLLFGALGKAEAIYNLDTAAAIHFGDWTNKNGSYGYDIHSIYGDPDLTANGHLQASSPARGEGSDGHPYSAADLEHSYIQFDIDGQARPGKNDSIDIGADEYKK